MTSELFIAGVIPEFKSKDVSWFRRNRRNIEHGRVQNPLWQRNALTINTNWPGGMRTLIEKLLDMGYRVSVWPDGRGEFTLRGGILLLYPVNEQALWRIDFFGNTIESIEPLRNARSELKKIKTSANRELFAYLRSGDFVVHQDHGIGIWRGITKEPGSDYFLIEYRGPRGGQADTLLVPIQETKRITPYIGFRAPPVTRLGTPLWQRTIKHTREDAVLFAKKLLTIHASRSLALRPPYPPAEDFEKRLEASFPYDETLAQKRVLKEVTEDLESTIPMDRVVIGDVGFGKTEIALRASVRVAASGRQVAILAPTTVLAAQHFEVWHSRLKDIPVEVARLSRLESKSIVQKTLDGIARGTIDIIIGTHRILSRDVVWKNLGLLIIDEEQRFGVRAKEHLKELKKEIDVLTLSATPLPRTLSLALSQVRRMSALDEAPIDRLAPETFVSPYKKEMVKHAIEREIERLGQVYYIEARVRTIASTLEFLTDMLPKRKIGFIHGKVGEKALIETMERFRSKEIEILISTTIIENGIDLADVNTLIVSDATRFGLSELHQLRGRVGRSIKESFAYFFYNPERLTAKASARLDILSSTQFLGAGSVIAERDLEMRGAGNILGREQSGSASRVGLNLYSQFLAEAVEKLRDNSSF